MAISLDKVVGGPAKPRYISVHIDGKDYFFVRPYYSVYNEGSKSYTIVEEQKGDKCVSVHRFQGTFYVQEVYDGEVAEPPKLKRGKL